MSDFVNYLKGGIMFDKLLLLKIYFRYNKKMFSLS